MFLLRKIPLPYRQYCYVLARANIPRPTQIFVERNIFVSILDAHRWSLHASFPDIIHIYFGHLRVYIDNECTISLCIIFKMAEIQVKKSNKQAPECRHFMSDWDSYNYWPYCRDKRKGDDICVREKPEDC